MVCTPISPFLLPNICPRHLSFSYYQPSPGRLSFSYNLSFTMAQIFNFNHHQTCCFPQLTVHFQMSGNQDYLSSASSPITTSRATKTLPIDFLFPAVSHLGLRRIAIPLSHFILANMLSFRCLPSRTPSLALSNTADLNHG
jgi:hypothetical protein